MASSMLTTQQGRSMRRGRPSTDASAGATSIYGYTHAFGGYAGAHAQYVRVPFADNDCFKVPDGVADQTALFLSDAAPTGYMGADFCNVQPGDTVAVWGCAKPSWPAARAARCQCPAFTG